MILILTWYSYLSSQASHFSWDPRASSSVGGDELRVSWTNFWSYLRSFEIFDHRDDADHCDHNLRSFEIFHGHRDDGDHYDHRYQSTHSNSQSMCGQSDQSTSQHSSTGQIRHLCRQHCCNQILSLSSLIFTTTPSSAFLAGPSNNTGSTSLSAQNQNHNGYARPFQVARLKLWQFVTTSHNPLQAVTICDNLWQTLTSCDNLSQPFAS